MAGCTGRGGAAARRSGALLLVLVLYFTTVVVCGRTLRQEWTTGEDELVDYEAMMPSAAMRGLAAVNRTVEVGLFQGKTSPGERERKWNGGKHLFDTQLIFQPVYGLKYSEVKAILDDNRKPVLNMEVKFPSGDSRANEPVLHHVLTGQFDGYFKKFAQDCAAGKRNITIRTFHEYNGNWYQWGILYGSRSNPKPQYPNTQTRLKDAFKRVIKIFTDNKAPVQFQLNINANNGYDDKTPFATWWPGTVGLSSVAITAYNRACSTPSHQDSKPFRDRFSAAYNQVKALTPLPIWVAETGTTSCKTDKPKWVREAFRDIAQLFPQVVQVTWFLLDKFEEGTTLDWDMHDRTDTDKPTWVKEAFRDIALLFPQVVQVTWFLTDKLQEGVVTDWDMHDGTKEPAAFVSGYNDLKTLTAPPKK